MSVSAFGAAKGNEAPCVTRRRWIVGALMAYGVVACVILLIPVSYSTVIDAVWMWLRAQLGLTWFGVGWIEFLANVVLFVPLGFLLTLLLRHHWRGVALALILSAAAELAQVVIPSRVPSLRDILANTLGAAAGAALAWLLVIRTERSPAGTDQHQSDT